MLNVQTMTAAYIEAIYFTETGDGDQPDADAELTPLCKAQAYIDCRNFISAIGPYHEAAVNGYDDLDESQLGHDLWLTRNGHGTGFWDREPSVYSSTNATLFCRLATAMGGHDAEFVETEGETSCS